MNKRLLSWAVAASLAVAPLPGRALAPAVLLMIKQIAQQAASSMIKDTLLSSLNGMGCKGIALSNALSALDARGGSGLGMGLGMGLGATGPAATALSPELMARARELMPGAGQLPPGMALDPSQMAMLGDMQRMLGQPLSPAEAVATIDELFELGFMPKAIQAEFKECMVLVPASVQALGMGMGMMKPMIPQLRQAREQLRALSPAEQDEVAAELALQVKALPADQQGALLEHLDAGFFPPRVAQGVKASLGRQPK